MKWPRRLNQSSINIRLGRPLGAFAIVLVWLCFSIQRPVFAQATGEKSPIVIQTVPAADLPRFLTNERPLRRSVFEEYLQGQTAGQLVTPARPSDAQIIHASYEAQFSPIGSLRGKATVEVSLRGSSPARLPTPGFTLSVDSLQWKDREDPVVWGLGPSGQMVLQVPRSGELQFDWECRAIMPSSQRCEFDVGLLSGVETDMTISAPAPWKSSMEGIGAISIGTESMGSERRRYQLGAMRSAKLRLENSALASAQHPNGAVRQKTRIDVGRQGIDLRTELEVDPANGPISEILLRVDQQLQIVSASMGGQPIQWTLHSKDNESTVRLQFASPLVDSGRKILLEARAPLVSESMTALPQVRPTEANWRESEIDLNIAPPLELTGLELVNARITDGGPVTSARGGESRNFRLYSPSAEVRCVLHAGDFDGRARIAAKVSASETSFDFRGEYRIAAESGEAFDLTAAIVAGWVIDSVESTPQRDIESWSVSSDDSRQRLALRLSRSLSVKSPLRFRITAHLPRVGNENLSTSSFHIANFDRIEAEDGFLVFDSESRVRLEAAGDNVTSVAPDLLTAEDRDLLKFDATDAARIYSLKREFSILHGAASPEIQVECSSETLMLDQKALTQHKITIDPQQRQLDRVELRVFPATSGDLVFSMKTAPTLRLSAQRVASDDRGDHYELRFAEPITESVQLTAIEETSVQSEHSCRMVFHDSASTRECTVYVLATNPKIWQIDANSTALFVPRPKPLNSVAELGAFRAFAMENQPILVKRTSAKTQTGPWAWLASRVTVTGDEFEDLHDLILIMDGQRAETATFQLAENSKLIAVLIDGEETQAFQLAGRELRIPLTRSRTERKLQIRVAGAREKDFLGIRELKWQGAAPEFTVLTGDWTIWTPPQTAIARDDHGGSLWNSLALVQHTSTAESPKSMRTSAPRNEVDLSRSGWTETHVNDASTVALYSPGSWRLASWFVLALVTLATVSTLKSHAHWAWIITLLVALAALTSLAVPSPFHFVLSGGILGGIFGLLLHAVLHVRLSTVSVGAVSIAPVRAILFFVILNSACGWGLAQPPLEALPQKQTSADRSVFDPVDAEGKALGDFVYVSPELFEKLVLSAPARQREPCLIREAKYRAERSSTPPTSLLQLSAEFTVFSDAESSMVALSALAKDVEIVGNSIVVDGELQTMASGEQKQRQLTLQGRGDHIIRFEMRIPLLVDGNRAIAELETLLVGKQLLEVMTDSPLIWSVDGTAIQPDPLTREAVIRLMPGRTTRIEVRREEESGRSQDASLRHDAWFTVSPGAISIEHLIRVVPDTTATSLLFELEDGFRLESIAGDNRRPITPIKVSDRRWRATLDTPLAGDASLRVLTTMTNSNQSGKLTTTGITFSNAKTVTTRVAVSVSPDLIVESESRPGATAVSPAEFASSWPPGRSAPQVAMAVEPNRAWSIAVRPRAPQTSARQETEYTVHPKSMEIQFDAEVATGGDPVSVYELRVPPTLRLESLAVLEGSVNRLVRYARTLPDRITIFARTSSTETRQIKLRGIHSFDPSGPIPIPAILVEQSNITSHILRIFRGFDANVEISQTKGLRASDLASFVGERNSVVNHEQSRLLAVFEPLPRDAAWEGLIAVSPNKPTTICESRIRFEAKDSKWQYAQTISLKIENGVVDELELTLPAGMRDPISLEPGEATRVVRAEGGPSKLVIVPAKPWRDSCEFILRGDYFADSATSELIFRPMRPLGVSTTTSWIAAPKQSGNGEFNWKGDGTEEVEAPAGEQNASDYRWFKQRATDSYIQLQTAVSSLSVSPRLENQVTIAADQFSAVMTWRWPSPISNEITLISPPGVRIVDARIIGSMARISQSDDQQWTLRPTPGAAPPTIEVICVGSFKLNQALLLPRFDGVAVAQTVLLVEHPASIPVSPESAVAVVEERAALFAQLRLLEQTKRDVQPVLSTLSQSESSSWRRAWIAAWDAERGRLSRAISDDGPSNDAEGRWLSEADADRARTGQEMAGVASEPTADSDAAVNNVAIAIRDENFGWKRQMTCFVSDEKTLVVRFVARDPISDAAQTFRKSFERSPWAIPVGGCGLLILFLFASIRTLRATAGRLAPIAATVCLGAAWWVWLSPPWLGLVIVLIAALAIVVRAFSPVRRATL